MVKITGTIINYYIHCKRQCWLFMKKINLEDNSENVKIGKVLHEARAENDDSEISVENIKVDKITDQYVIELKKSDADLEAAIKQVQYYLYILREKGIERKGRVEVLEKNKQNRKIHNIEYNEKVQKEIEKFIQDIDELYHQQECPSMSDAKKCKNCAYYEYCNI